MDVKELLADNVQAHKRLALITREIFEMLSDEQNTGVLGKSQLNELLAASFHFLKESSLLLPMIEKELNLLGGEEGDLESQLVNKLTQAEKRSQKSSIK